MSETPEWTGRIVYGEETLDALRSEIERLHRWRQYAIDRLLLGPQMVAHMDEYAALGTADRDGAATDRP